MTVPSKTSTTGPQNGNDVTTNWPYSFAVQQAADLRVVIADSNGVETELVLDTDFSIGAGETFPRIGGSIDYPISGSPLASGSTITILRALDYKQAFDFTNQGTTWPEVVESMADKLTMMIQQTQEEVDRSVKVNASSSADPATLIANAAANAAAAAASEAAAAASASAASASASAASGSASGASTSAGNAATSATAASNSATSASTSASNAATSASGAATSAGNASSSASSASSSASAASTSASDAATSETNAGNSATAAAGSASAASASAASAAISAASVAQQIYVGPDTGVVNAYVVVPTSGPDTVVDGTLVLTKIAVTNTGGSTLAFDGDPAAQIRLNGAALTGGELVAGNQVLFRYDGAVYEIAARSGGEDTDLSSLTVGSPTGGNKGAGTVNVQNGLYLNNTHINQVKAAAWVQFSSTGVIRDSFGVSSVTHDGTGLFTVNLSSAMSNNDYAAFVTGSLTVANEEALASLQYKTTGAILTTTTVPVAFANNAGTLRDPGTGCVIVFGDH